ncbi:MAG TPA: AsmA-like C-terminal domain-containing protein [Syntrophales bacterium]|nr:AsmA-like C-terminal domain-containing protein [Syntrophales bacterium]
MKKPSRKTIVILLITLIVFISAAAGITVVLIKLSDLDAYKGDIISALNKKLNREVSYERGDFSFYFGPIFTFSGIKIKERDGQDTFATIEKITFRVAILPLLWKKIIFKEVFLERPTAVMYRDRKGIFNINDLLEGQEEAPAVEIERMAVSHGNLTFTDEWIIPAGLTTILDDINLKIGYPAPGKKNSINISTSIIQDGKKGNLSVTGYFRLSERDEPLAKSSIDTRITAANISVERYRPYYEKYVPFLKVAGDLDLDTHLRGNLYQFSSEGSIGLKRLNLRYPEVFHAALTPKEVGLDYTLKRSPSEVIIEALNLSVDDVKVSGSFAIKDINKDDPLITATASSSPIPLEKFGHFIPYGIIPRGVADFIETRIKGGTYQLKEGSLNGRVSQIAHMEVNDNYNVLYIKAGVDKGLLAYGRDVPVFSGIRGELELRGRDFLLHGMSGNFGESPMMLEGKITDYCTSAPTEYQFTMTMTPGQKEIAWLLGRDGDNKFAFTGKTTLQMSGSGPLNNYTLEGNWDLSGAAYSYSDVFTKPQAQGNRLAFKTSFKSNEVRLESFSCQLAGLAVTAAGLYNFKDKDIFSLSVNSNPFQIEDLSTNLPRMMKYQPSGRIQLSANGSGISKSIADLNWRGSIQFSDVSFKPTETSRIVSALSGTVNLRKNRFDTSPLSGRLGNSLIKGRVTLKDFKNPSVSVTAASALFDLEDLGWRSPAGEIKLRDFVGNIVFKDKGLQIKWLSARVNDSVFNITGAMPDVKKTFFNIHVSSPSLDTDDVILLSKINIPGKEKPALSLKASVQSDKGKISRVSYSDLRATLTYRQQILDVPALAMNIFGGRFSGIGHLAFANGNVTQYQAGFIIEGMSAEQILRYAGTEKELITGTVTMQGNVTAEGASASDFKKTAQGTATLKMEKGTLNRFAFLSKVFSILNVSQLFKFKLPDMVNDGMPYTTITGTFSLKDGILSSNDLFVNSNAMNMSFVGKTDIINEELDLNIGIQPLQTVDKVVSIIPVVGWILTSDTKGLITLYFEAKGKWNDPAVNAIPVKSMARGVFDIFKKLFLLPAKLITDTGEVITGQ